MNAQSACPVNLTLPAELDDSEFSRIQQLALDWAGINLEQQQRAMLYSRFYRRLRELRLSSFGEYITYATDNELQEREYFVNTVTTNLTYFFREPHHFTHLVNEALPELIAKPRCSNRIRLWSSACSSGQEPYSMAIALANSSTMVHYDARILCTDINTKMVARTRAGYFDQDELRGLSVADQQRWFTPHSNGIIANDSLKNLMLCNTLNLFSNWPFKVAVDVIFCRNALIYFSSTMQKQLIAKFARIQPAGSFLYLGHSEVIRGINAYYDRIENTVYRRRQ